MSVSMPRAHPLERALRHDRWILLGGLGLMTALAWTYTLAGAGMDMGAAGMAPAARAWTFSQAGTALAMWWVMMIAMMVPSAAPTILLSAALNRRSNAARPPFGSAGAFAAGYLTVWLLFSIAAATVQGLLQSTGLLTPMLQVSGNLLAGAILLTAGAWQLTPAKRACLRHCRSPIDFLVRPRRPGGLGAFLVGISHGGYCVGCCWVLMALLFVGGVMNPYWIVALTLYVVVEKQFLRGERIGKVAGVVLVLAGLLMLQS